MEFIRENQKEWLVNFENGICFRLNLIPSSVTNRFNLVTEFIERVAEFNGDPFDKWLETLLTDASDEGKRPAALFNSIDEMKKYVNAYLESTGIDYSQFVDESKAKKNSILFQADEIARIIKLSSYLKVYAIFTNTENLRVGESFHQELYNKIASEVADTEIISKIYKVIQTKTFRYKLTDNFMWEYIKTIQCKDIGVHVIEIFNFIMNNILILCEEDKNPITYFVGVVDESVKWFLRSVYKGHIIYDDTISTEDIHSGEKDNLRTYSFNDTLGRLKDIAYKKIYSQIERDNLSLDKSDQLLTQFHNRIDEIKYISPLAQCLVYPVFAKITEIPYIHFKAISPTHSAILSYYAGTLLQGTFGSDYKNLFALLEFFPASKPSVTTTYKVKSSQEYLNLQNSLQNFFGFNTKNMAYYVLCHFAGRVSRINFVHVLTGQELPGIPLGKVEMDMIHFYSNMFASKFDDKFKKMVNLMNKDF